jgi:hypothetical protein
MSDRHLFFELTNAAKGRDVDFNAWYDTYHVKEVVANCRGFVAARRYKLDPLQRSGEGSGEPSPWGYIAVYELEADDPEEVRALKTFANEGGFTSHDGSLASERAAWVYTPVGKPAAGGKRLGDEEHLFLAFTNPSPGRDADFDRWYERRLEQIVARFPGFVSGRRYIADPANHRPGESPKWQSLALYELRGDLAEIHRADADVRISGTLISDDGALDPNYAVWVYTPHGQAGHEAGA